MVDVRIYRTAFLPALLALLLLMFSFQERPAPLISSLAPDAFDLGDAHGLLLRAVNDYPDRRPGSSGDAGLARFVSGHFRNLGLETSNDSFTSDAGDGSAAMVNVVGVLSGESDREIVVLAHRDSPQLPGASSAAATATLLELATALTDARHSRTIVFASVDGSGADSAGARRFAEHYRDRGKVEDVLVLDDVASASARRPFVVPWSTSSGRAPLQLMRTVAGAIERESGGSAGSSSVFSQFVRQAWPLTLREQGPLIQRGLDAITLTSQGEIPIDPRADTLARISEARLLRFGKAALASVLALDAAPSPAPSSRTFVVVGRRVLPGWTVSLLAMGLLAPVLAGAVDGFARARRRRLPVGAWARWALGTSVPFLVTLVAAWGFRLVGWLPSSASEALAPASRPSLAESAPPLGALVVLFVIAWVVARPIATGSRAVLARPERPEAGVGLALVLSLELLLLWMVNPFATLLLVPVAHGCFLSCLPESPNRPLLVGALVASALLLPALVILHYGSALHLGLDVSRYALLMLTGSNSFLTAVIASLIAGSLVCTVAVALGRRPGEGSADITVRGPRSYAGPGSLGGTESALP